MVVIVVVVTVVPGGGAGGSCAFVFEEVFPEDGTLTFVSALERPLLEHVESLTLSSEDEGASKDVTDFSLECSLLVPRTGSREGSLEVT